jgi:hypothetical protein
MSERYVPSTTTPRFERWLLIAILIGCLLAGLIAYGAFSLATKPSVPTPTIPAGQVVDFITASFSRFPS